MPIGSGLGTFVPVYAMFEKPEDTFMDAYVNHAHNDLLELWLDTGAMGLVLMAIFVIWFVPRSIEIWRNAPPGAREIDWSLARAGTIIVALVAAHSFVDYPLRTSAMMAIIAFASALLIDPPIGSEDLLAHQALHTRTGRRGARRLEPAPSPALSRRPMPSASAEPSEVPSPALGEWWDANTQWPEEWRKPSEPPGPGGQPPKSLKPRP